MTDRIWDGGPSAGKASSAILIPSRPAGTFAKRYFRHLEGCRAVLVVIGREWIRDLEGRRRLDSAEDHVRIEIETALAREGLPVIPVLVRQQGTVKTSATPPVSVERLFKGDEGEAQEKLVPSPSGATKERPLENSLGMRFVLVPGTSVLFSILETRVKDYQAFWEATKKSRGLLRSLFWRWTEPAFRQTGDHPAVNVREDATAFCEWLSQREGQKYRLPTDHEPGFRSLRAAVSTSD